MIIAIKFIGLILCSYMLGNILFGRIISKYFLKDDITKKDSGNPGMSNMMRNHGIIIGALTFILDALKGAIPAIVGFFMFGGWDGGQMAYIGLYVGGASAVIGHIFPVVYKFKGGKGVSTAAGLCFVAQPIATPILFACYIIVLISFKIFSLGSLFAAVSYIITDTVLLILNKRYWCIGIMWVVFLLIVYAFRGNIQRLLAKKEIVFDVKKSLSKDAENLEKIKNRYKEKHKKQNKSTQSEIITDKNSVYSDDNNDKK